MLVLCGKIKRGTFALRARLEILEIYLSNFLPKKFTQRISNRAAERRRFPSCTENTAAQREEEGIVVSNLFVYNTFRLQTSLLIYLFSLFLRAAVPPCEILKDSIFLFYPWYIVKRFAQIPGIHPSIGRMRNAPRQAV
jgi:hypothetical protein